MAPSLSRFARLSMSIFSKTRPTTSKDGERIAPLLQRRFLYAQPPSKLSGLRPSRTNLLVSFVGCSGGILAYLALKSQIMEKRFLPHVDAAKVIEPSDTDELKGGNDITGSTAQRFNFIADVVEKTAPAVVGLEIKDRHPFFGTPVIVSNGSGFIVQADGLILTNAHVVANKASVNVKLQDGRTFTGTVEDIDPVSDLATVKIQCKNLPVLRLGTSSKLRPGEWVVAMGSPLSLSNTITAGVISTVHRESKELGIHNKNIEFIQTDASINDGEAIGINTLKVTAGISFAVPADYAKEFLKTRETKIKQESSSWFGLGSSSRKSVPKRRYLGITMISLTPSLIVDLQQRQANFPEDVTHGVLVWKVLVGSPAYKGGLYPGDIVSHINGNAINSSSDVNKALESQGELILKVLRKHKHLTIKVLPEESE